MKEQSDKLLSGKRIVLLRAIQQAQELAEKLKDLGADVLLCPMIELVPEKEAIAQITKDFLKDFDTLIFTSCNGVKIFMESLRNNHFDLEIINDKNIVVVGPKTKETALEFGITVKDMPTTYVAEGVMECFEKDLKNHRILIATSKDARSILSEDLIRRGAHVKMLHIYKNVVPLFDLINIEDDDFIVFTSSSTANHFFQSNLYKKQKIIAFCIGHITAATVTKYLENNIHIAKEATTQSIVSCIAEHIQKENNKRSL